MRRTTMSVLVAQVLLLAAMPLAAAQDAARNAALHYWRAWDRLHLDADDFGRLGRIGDLADPRWRPAADVTRRVRAVDRPEVLAEFAAASRFRDCDFGLDPEGEIAPARPELAALHRGAILLTLDARLRLDAGDVPGAVERLAAGYRIAEHCAAQPFASPGRHAGEIFGYVDAVAAYAVEQGALDASDPDAVAPLRAALERFDDRDPFALRAAIREEIDLLVPNLRRRLTGPDARREIDELFGYPFSPPDELLATIGRADDMDEQVDGFERFLRRLLAAWSEPEARADIADLVDEAEANRFGHLAAAFAGAYLGLHEHDERARVAFRTARDRFAP